MYRVSFCGVYPSLLPTGDKCHTYTRETRILDVARALYDQEPSAYQLDRWEPQTRQWVLLAVRDPAAQIAAAIAKERQRCFTIARQVQEDAERTFSKANSEIIVAMWAQAAVTARQIAEKIAESE